MSEPSDHDRGERHEESAKEAAPFLGVIIFLGIFVLGVIVVLTIL